MEQIKCISQSITVYGIFFYIVGQYLIFYSKSFNIESGKIYVSYLAKCFVT